VASHFKFDSMMGQIKESLGKRKKKKKIVFFFAITLIVKRRLDEILRKLKTVSHLKELSCIVNSEKDK